MTVVDGNGSNLLDITNYRIEGGPLNTNNIIDTQNIGVYQVVYSVDYEGVTTSATRAIVVTDGREVIDNRDPDDLTDGVIILARDFTMLQKDVRGTKQEVLDNSTAMAYTEDGVRIIGGLDVANFDPTVWREGLPINEAGYPFTLVVDGKVDINGNPVQKHIRGIVAEGDVIFPGGLHDQYSIVASHFRKTISEADDMRTDKYNQEIAASKTKVFKLVAAAPDARPFVKSDSNFPGSSQPPAIRGEYDVTFGIQKNVNGAWGTVLTIPASEVTITATVVEGEDPVLTVTSPLELPVGTAFNLSAGVLLTDAETPNLTAEEAILVTDDGQPDKQIGDPTIVNPVNSAQPGIYPLQYAYRDADGNATEGAIADGQRVVVINDGHFTVSPPNNMDPSNVPEDLNGRILYGSSFVIKKSEVANQEALLNNQIVQRSMAKAIDGKTGVDYGGTSVNVLNRGGYSVNEGTYPIILSTNDVPSGAIQKNINAVVVDAQIIVSDDVDGDGPKEFGDTTYVYGQNLSMRAVEARSIAIAELDSQAGVRGALKLGAVLTAANGAVSDPGIQIVDTDNFRDRLSDDIDTNNIGTYRFTVTDGNNKKTAVFTITISDPPLDTELIVTPKPLRVDRPVTGDDVDASGNLSRQKIMQGVSARDGKVVSPQNPTGDVTAQVTYVLFDENGTPINSIPTDRDGFYKATYTYIDGDQKQISDSRGIVVGDDFVVDEYVIRAKSFIINKSQVKTDTTGREAQLLELTEAKAWTLEGDVVPVYIESEYTNTIISGIGHSITVTGGTDQHIVYAKVIEDQTGSLPPGDNMQDGNSDNGIDYSIYAHNFRINEVDANALAAKKATALAEYANELVQRSGATSYSRIYSLSILGTAEYVEDSGFATSGELVEGDIFTVTFRVAGDHEALVTIKAFVHNGNPPVLTVPYMKSFPLNHNITDAEYMQGVSVTDVEDDNAVPPRPISISYDSSHVATNDRAIFSVTYTVTDSDHNTVTQDGLILIDFEIDIDCAVAATNFVTSEKAIQRSLDENATLEDIILENAHSEGYRLDLTDPTKPKMVPDNSILGVLDNAGFGPLEGVYDGVMIGVDPAAGLLGSPVKEISAKVIKKDIISTDPGPDASDNDENKGDPNDNQYYLVGANSPVSINVSTVPDYVFGTTAQTAAAKVNLIAAAQAEGYKYRGETVSHPVDVIANEIPADAQVGDSYYVTFAPQGVNSVWVKVQFNIIAGHLPELNIDGPLVIPATDDPRELNRDDLMQGVGATDEEAKTSGNPSGDISGDVVITDGNAGEPDIDTSVAGLYSVEYAVTDVDGNEVKEKRTVVINDGRYKSIDSTEPADGVIDIIIGAKNYVVRQSDVANTLQHVRAKSWAEAYDTKGNDLSAQLTLVGAIPTGYSSGIVGEYTFTWAVNGHDYLNNAGNVDPNRVKTITARVISDDYVIDPRANEKASKYAAIAKDFTRAISRAALIRVDADYIAAAQAEVVELIDGIEDKLPTTANTGGFTSTQGLYPITFGIKAPSTTAQASVMAVITGAVTNGQAPIITSDEPIYFPIVLPTGSVPYNQEQIKTQGHVAATDAEDINLTRYVTVTNPNTGNALTVPSDQKGVYQALLSVTDSDGNTTQKIVGISVGIVPADFMIDANDFTIDSGEVSPNMAVQQILQESGARAWKRDGTPIPVSVVSTDGYSAVPATYRPVLGVYDNSEHPGTPIGDPAAKKTINANVVDGAVRYTVTFNANGGTLRGPDRITVVAPNTLPYLPVSPDREGYNFMHWTMAPIGGAQFTITTPIDRNYTVYAQWREIPGTVETEPPLPPDVIVTPPTIIVNDPPNSTTIVQQPTQNQRPNVTVNPPAVNVTVEDGVGEAPIVEVYPEVPAAPDVNVTVEAPEQTPITLPATPTPLAEPEETETHWSLFNLIATILALLLALIFAIKLFFDRPKSEEYEEEPVDSEFLAVMTPAQRDQYQKRRDADRQAWLANQEKENRKQKAMFVNLPVLLIAAVAFVEAVILLFMTQDFYSYMVVVDTWSVVFSLILFVQLLTPMVAAVIHNSKTEKKADEYQQRKELYDGDIIL